MKGREWEREKVGALRGRQTNREEYVFISSQGKKESAFTIVAKMWLPNQLRFQKRRKKGPGPDTAHALSAFCLEMATEP